MVRSGLVICLAWAATFAQSTNVDNSPVTAPERYGVLGLLTTAIVAQYWENRKKDQGLQDALCKQSQQNQQINSALERLSGSIESLQRAIERTLDK
jgi:uncharacterized protein YlxW (UPF0749 family)